VDRIGRITTSGTATEFSMSGGQPLGITAGPDGNLWFTEGIGEIGRITPSGVVTEFIVPSSRTPADQDITGITAGPDGNLWFTEYRAGIIGRITLAGVVTEYLVPTSTCLPFAITAGPDGNLWFSEQGANQIGRLTPAGVFTEFPAGSQPTGLTADPDNNLWFTELNAGNVGQLQPAFTVTVPASISGHVFLDNNGDGVENGADAGLASWTVQLLDPVSGSVLASQTTNGSGNYSFTQLIPGTYGVRAAIPAGWLQTTANPPDLPVSTGSNVNAASLGLFPFATLAGTTLSIHGTVRNDQFAFLAGSPSHQIAFDGVGYTVAAAAVNTIRFDGNGGSDTATLTGTGSGETAMLSPNTGQLQGAGYTVTVNGVASMVVNGGAGETAYLFDGPGNDTLIGTPTYVTLSGPGFSNTAAGFATTSAFASTSQDAAYLFDGSSNDLFIGTPTYSYFQVGASLNIVSGYTSVRGSSSGGSDLALLFDGAGNDIFVGYATYSYLGGTGFLNLVAGFAEVRGSSTAGQDAAYVYDSARDDLFRSTPSYNFLAGSGFLNLVSGFAQVNAVAGGSDTADLYDTPGNDTGTGQGSTGTLVTPTYTVTVNRFALVRVASTAAALTGWSCSGPSTSSSRPSATGMSNFRRANGAGSPASCPCTPGAAARISDRQGRGQAPICQPARPPHAALPRSRSRA
jgi:hypothetical protein